MNILVTGGCGFIGTNFIYYMLHEHDHTIINLDKLTYAGNLKNLISVEGRYNGQRYFFEKGDICDTPQVMNILKEYEIDAVVNFAAESHVDRSISAPDQFIESNIQGTYSLLTASSKAGIKRFIQVSTDEVYGSLGPEGLFTEESPLAPNSPYAASKASADLLCRSFFKTYGFPVIVTRCSNNYGPFQFPEKLVPLSFLRAKEDRPVPVYGTGSNVRDWIYVSDHCRGIDLCLRKGRPGAIYNFGGDAEYENLDVIKKILDIMGKSYKLIKFVKDRPGHDQRYAMDYSLAKDELGFEPQVRFSEGLELTINWYLKNEEWVDGIKSGEYIEFMEKWYKERS
ncbi:dTDP-glucose 4,6-dehydratase [Desulfonatronovibrio hydrogenovorans]|uniref:dTDP-glucose 4,6-dehydratase n=1 Tax=Desulfonatronovibrio hydrogenovorans TaxID=53245 RepID=UPI000490359A|nr:dTDP-glucose 4,6-dehydratase [Desulfonatronovibrio hydrogenovorans]